MSYIGDFSLGQTLNMKFTTIDAGIPTSLAGSPVVVVYKDNNTTEITSGITLVTDFDSRTGLNNVNIVATSGNGFAAGSDYDVVVSVGTVGEKSLVGYVIKSFSIENRFLLTASGIRSALGLASANLDTQFDAIPTAAEINAEMVDTLSVDTYPEPGQEAPPATASLEKKLGYAYKFLRNKSTQDKDTGEMAIYGDDGVTIDQKTVVTDDGTIYTRNEIGSGP
jgi:hypothetical protein